MKTLVVLLLLAVALGAGHWTAQRPGEGLDAFVDEARLTAERVGDGARDVALPAARRALASLSTPDGDAAPSPSTGTASGPSGTVAPGAETIASVPAVDPAIDPADPTAAAAAAPGTEPARLGGALPVAAEDVARTDDDLAAAADTVDALGSRVAALENELTRTMTSSESSVVQSRLDEAERRLAGTEDRLARALASLEGTPERVPDARLDAVDGRLELLTRRIDEDGAATREALAGLGDRFDALSARLERLDARADGARTELAGRVDALDERAETLDARIGTFAAGGARDGGGAADAGSDGAAGRALEATSLRVPGLGPVAGSGADAMPDVGRGVGRDVAARSPAGEPGGDAPAAGANPAPARAALAGVDRRLAALESGSRSDAGERARLAALDADLGSLADRLDALAERDARRDDALEALESSVGELATRSDALSIDAVQGRIRAELQSLAAEVGPDGAGGEADASSLVAALEATRERVAELEERVRDLPASSPAADGAQQTQSALESQIRALGQRIETLPSSSDASLASGLDEVRERVQELSTQGFVTQEELRAQVEGRHVEYKIYFDKNSTEIGDEAARVLDSFIAQETNRAAGVSIFGFTDTKGSVTYNQQLAQRRAANVRSYLIRNGFDYTKIDNVAGLGEDAAAAILGDEQEDAGQRVVVLFAAQI